MNELYREVLPLKYLWLGGGSGSSGSQGGGGGTTTTNNTTENKQLTWGQYVPGVTSEAYNQLVPQLQARANTGLSPQERAYYTGQGMTQQAQTQGGAQKSLAGNLARSGARGGAATEAYGDLARSQVLGGAGIASGIMGQDVAQKGANTDRLMKAIALPSAPITTGTTATGTTNYAPQKQSGGGGS